MTTLAVVEDNADNRLLLQAILDGLYDLVEYENGVDALAGLAASLPDLVLLDISLPGMDGNEILARIRADAGLRRLPVIALTAHAMAGDREKYLAAGFNDYITKPIVDETILLGAIEKWLGASRRGEL
ncbi:MAG: response regulator receiver protein [Gemmatimonadetes bacterium]|jgi:CheY-like chemotaxis protein|nr:response regulator receiver protein [Gemmatimonadota bacterium]